jgi:hypothetical protein
MRIYKRQPRKKEGFAAESKADLSFSVVQGAGRAVYNTHPSVPIVLTWRKRVHLRIA